MPPSTPPDRAPSGDVQAQPPGLSQAPPARRTLPPPEWLGRDGPRSAASLLLERLPWGAPVARKKGPRAELAQLFAELETQSGDAHERAAAGALSRALATRGTQLDVATRLARRALLLGEDMTLREELAGWFVTLGEPALAAATLRPLVAPAGGADACALLVRIGVLLARAGEARAASEALTDAALADPTDPVPLEIQASIAAWAPSAVELAQAADAYLSAADRREERGEKAAAFEDLMRAFEICPVHAQACERLAGALLARARGGAADEIRREHAAALGDAGKAAHLRRMRQAVKDGDLPRALGAAFDARLDAEIDLRSVLGSIDPVGADETPLGIDGLLERAGMHELLAARVEIASDFLAGRERARARIALGRLYTGPLGRADRAVDAWIDALVADPASDVAREALRRHGVITRDYSPLVEALVRVVGATSATTKTERVSLAQELLVLADERLGDPGLAGWALSRLSALAGESAELRATDERLAPRLVLQDETLAEARAELERASGSGRAAPLMRVATILAGRPDASDTYIEVLRELAGLEPNERQHVLALERVLARLGKSTELEALLEGLVARAGSGVERARARLALATLRRRRGDAGSALEALTPLFEEPGVHGPAYSLTLFLAAQLGDHRARALALARVAAQLPPSLRAVLLAVAAEEQLLSGDVEGARAAAEQACNADPSLARPAAARARVGVAVGGRAGAEAIERALSIVVPRPALTFALATLLDDLGEPLLATAWAQRAGTLRPGDLAAASARVSRAGDGDDGARLADTLAWFLSQPQRLAPASELVARSIERVAALAPGRAGALARRALDVLGPRDAALRGAVLRVADKVGERGLGIAAIERWLATGSLGGERGPVLLDLARRRKLAGDADGAARALSRALAEGAPAGDVLPEVDAALPTRSSDGEIALLQARAEVLSALPEADARGTASAWRELGAALWDLAADRAGALRAWERAAALDAEHGAENFASDLLVFGGEGLALERLVDHARRRGDTPEAARYYGLAASVALGTQRLPEAFAHAQSTLEIDPTRSDAIAVAERAAGDGELDALEGLYDRLAASALGCFGERAVRYRAARMLEKRGLSQRALRHAVFAFEAVPSEGVAFVTLARLADKTGQRGEVVRAIERVAERSDAPELGAAWLRRAALFADESEEGRRQRVDVLLRALSVRVDAELVASLALAMGALIREQPDERDASELRFARAARSVLARGEGPEGARVAIEVALAALVTFDAGVLAVDALERAARCDGDLEQFARLAPHAETLAQVPVSAALLPTLIALGEDRFASAGAPLLELGAAIAEARGDAPATARLLMLAARRDHENTGLLKRAEAAARKTGDPALIASVVDALPDRGRFDLVMELVAAADRAGDVAQALEALKRARSLLDIEPAQRDLLFERSLDLLGRAGRRDELEQLLEAELARSDLAPSAVARVATDLAALVGARGRPQAALDVLSAALERVPDHAGMLGDAATVARQAGDRARQAWALGRLLDRGGESTQAISWLRELAPLLESLGEEAAALARWTELARLSPNEPEALVALERDAERQGDYETVARLLDRRAALAGRVDDVRRLRLRRASVLEQRLARPDEARSELETLLAATGDHLSVLRVLADLADRLGDPLVSAPLWLRASALSGDRNEAAELARRACKAYLEGGDVEGAHRTLEGLGAWVERAKLLELSVEIERRRENPAGLAGALDELATYGQKTPEERARLLVEAARATLAAGDRDKALERAVRAARSLPGLPDAELLARHLEYLTRGVGSADEAGATLEALGRISEPLGPEQAALRAFLCAEALDRVQGSPEAGLAALEREVAAQGPRPLLALGKAERLSALDRPGAALAEFDLALEGDLFALRSRARTALLAGEAARRAGELERALRYFELGASDPDTQSAARAALERVRAELTARSPLASGRDEMPEVVASFDVFDDTPIREHVVLDQDDDAPAVPVTLTHPPATEPLRSQAAPPAVTEPPAATQASPAMPAAVTQPPVTVPSATLSQAFAAATRSSPPATLPPTTERLPSAARAEAPRAAEAVVIPAPIVVPPAPSGLLRPLVTAPPEPRIESAPVTTLPPSTATESPLPRSVTSTKPPSPRKLNLSGTFAGNSAEEVRLHVALADGSREAGLELLQMLLADPSRVHDRVAVYRRLALLTPGDAGLVAELARAAGEDKNSPYVAAVSQVLALLRGEPSPEPPSLLELDVHPEAARALLFRETRSPTLEALALVWETAGHLFQRDPGAYGITGLERVQPMAPTPLGRAYGGIARALGSLRTPLFQRRTAGPVTVGIALLASPAVVLSGDVTKDAPELHFHLGAMLAAAAPQLVMLFGLPEAQARSVLRALGFAFGPSRPDASGIGPALNLAELLWESIPARPQRRLRELCHDLDALDYDQALLQARIAIRRAGLFATGHLGVAVREVAAEEGLDPTLVASPRGWGRLAEISPSIMSLYQLSLSAEYAETRWHEGRSPR